VLTFLADENFNNDVVRGVRLRYPQISIVRVQDVGLRQATDDAILEWAAKDERVVLTHDVKTMTRAAYERGASGERMPGVFEVGPGLSVGDAIEEIHLLAECSLPGEWEGQVRYLPIR
jgi:Domain of unknown function (DUF5615)